LFAKQQFGFCCVALLDTNCGQWDLNWYTAPFRQHSCEWTNPKYLQLASSYHQPVPAANEQPSMRRDNDLLCPGNDANFHNSYAYQAHGCMHLL